MKNRKYLALLMTFGIMLLGELSCKTRNKAASASSSSSSSSGSTTGSTDKKAPLNYFTHIGGKNLTPLEVKKLHVFNSGEIKMTKTVKISKIVDGKEIITEETELKTVPKGTVGSIKNLYPDDNSIYSNNFYVSFSKEDANFRFWFYRDYWGNYLLNGADMNGYKVSFSAGCKLMVGPTTTIKKNSESEAEGDDGS